MSCASQPVLRGLGSRPTACQPHMVSTLNRGHYEADGQMLDEVYNYGPFMQSKMYAAGSGVCV